MHMGHILSVAAIQSCSVVNTVKPFNTVAVLMYHNVTDAIEPSYRSTRVKDFHDQMRYLKKKCEVISMRELIQLYQTPNAIGKTRKPRVVITLDDGFRDNYTEAYPILKKYGLPASIFIITNKVQWAKNSEPDAHRVFLSYKEMKEMRNNGITFCSHTQSHPNLSEMGFYDQKWQIQKGMQELYERFPDQEVLQAFAYPFGEYNQFTLDILKELNFKVGLTVWHEHNGPVENPLRLKRLTADGRDHIIKFAGQLNPYVFKAYQWYLKRTRKNDSSSQGPMPNLDSFIYEI